MPQAVHAQALYPEELNTVLWHRCERQESHRGCSVRGGGEETKELCAPKQMLFYKDKRPKRALPLFGR